MNTDKIQDIIRIFEESGLHKMELEVDDMKLKMEKQASGTNRVQFTEPLRTENKAEAEAFMQAAQPAAEDRKSVV